MIPSVQKHRLLWIDGNIDAPQLAKTPGQLLNKIAQAKPKGLHNLVALDFGVRHRILAAKKISGFPRRPSHARETTHHTDSQSITPHPLIARILLQGLVGRKFGRRNREDAHMWLETLAGIAVTALVWPEI